MKRLAYKIAGYLLIMTFLGHFYNFFHGDISVPVKDEESKILAKLMDTYKIDRYGSLKTMTQTLDGFVITWGFMIAFCAIITFITLKIEKDYHEILNKISIPMIILFGFSSIVAIIEWSAPVTILHILTTVAFTVSYFAKK
jgi:hypothetical protein